MVGGKDYVDGSIGSDIGPLLATGVDIFWRSNDNSEMFMETKYQFHMMGTSLRGHNHAHS